jgi:predicted DNA binding CopG/RHH family protein
MKSIEQRKNIENYKKFQLTYKGKPARITSDLSEETLRLRKVHNDTF